MTVNEALVLQIDELGGASSLGPGKLSVLCPICNSPTKNILFTQNGRGSFEAFAECGCHIREVITGLRRAVDLETHGKNGHQATKPRVNEPRYTTVEKPKDERTIFPLITFKELCALPPPQWQVRDFFLEETLVQVFGETNHGKSILLWDLCCTMCLGETIWFDREIVKPGPAVWVNADGGRGLSLRANAWAEERGDNLKYPLLTLMGAVHLNRADQIGAFRQQILDMDEKPAMIVFDTQSRCMTGGRENDHDEMSLVTDGLHRLKSDVGCTVIPIHHANVAGERERGSGIVKNEADTQIRVSKDEASGIFTVECKKGRDHAIWPSFYFRTKIVGGSVVIEPHGTPPPKSSSDLKEEGIEKVFEAIANEPSIEQPDICERTGLPRSTVYRYLQVLIEAKRIWDGPKFNPEMQGKPGVRPRGYWAKDQG